MILFLEIAVLFLMGAVAGWIIEFLYRGIISRGKWKNPGFLSGPWLPIYGFGTLALYGLSMVSLPLGYQLALIAAGLTLLELMAGAIFTRVYGIRLWDYSEHFLNFRGIICPLYSLFWSVLGAVFLFFIYPLLNARLIFLVEHLELSFFIGIFYGLILVDCISSFNILATVRTLSREAGFRLHQVLVNYDNLRLELRRKLKESSGKRLLIRFLVPFRGQTRHSLHDSIKKQLEIRLVEIKHKRKNKP